MDAPLQSVRLACICGARLDYTDHAFRVGVAEDEFRAQHQTELCRIAESLPACVGPTYGNDFDLYPCDVAECPACKPRRARP